MTPDEACQHALQLHQVGRLAEAEAIYRQIISHEPDHPDALHLLGMIIFMRGQPADALPLVERALRQRPNVAIYHNNIGQVLEKLGRIPEATTHYETAAKLNPRYPEARNNLANMRDRGDRMADAMEGYRLAIELKPDYAEAHTNLGNIHKDQGNLDEAIRCYRSALQFQPQPVLHDNLLLALHYHPAYGPAELAQEHRDWARRYLPPADAIRTRHANVRDPRRRLRLGYISPDLRDHAVGRFLLPLLRQHDRTQFELVAFADIARPDAATETFKRTFDAWHDITGRTDQQVVDLVAREQIDILVDLAAHTAGSRLLVFARKPAPVQVTYLAYCSTTGLDTVDYRLTDPYLDPAGTELGHYTEKTVRLPHTYWCYAAPEVAAATAGLPPRTQPAITFGCLNNFCKVTPEALDTWARILREVPGSDLVLYSRPGPHRERVRQRMRAAGIAERRVRFVGKQSFPEYFATYLGIDIGLDPFPFNGGTTTCDTLWMGVPVISLAGRTAVARAGLSLLSNVGLAEFVARSPDRYVQMAVELARDRSRLAELRASLRPRMLQSPLMDGPQFARDIEAAYRGMWETWCRSP